MAPTSWDTFWIYTSTFLGGAGIKHTPAKQKDRACDLFRITCSSMLFQACIIVITTEQKPVLGHHGVTAPIPDVFVLFRLGSHLGSCSHRISQDHEDMMSTFTSNMLPCKKSWPFNARTCILNMKFLHIGTFTRHDWKRMKCLWFCCCGLGRFIEFLAFLVVMDGSKVVLEGLLEWDKRWIGEPHHASFTPLAHCLSNKKQRK